MYLLLVRDVPKQYWTFNAEEHKKTCLKNINLKKADAVIFIPNNMDIKTRKLEINRNMSETTKDYIYQEDKMIIFIYISITLKYINK